MEPLRVRVVQTTVPIRARVYLNVGLTACNSDWNSSSRENVSKRDCAWGNLSWLDTHPRQRATRIRRGRVALEA
jgi:hypothetical protein